MNGMGQIATLADRLSTMSDQMLPQLAQQYKDDAITLSLILNEKNRRDRVRQTAQANPQQAMQQPKVNDQVVASMQPQQLPENVGIGTLPTPNIDNMAAGGLVAFADGGDVERYASDGSVQPLGQSLFERWFYSNITPYERERMERMQKEKEAEVAERNMQRGTSYASEREKNAAEVAKGKSYSPEAYGVKEAAPLYAGARRGTPQPAAPTVDAVGGGKGAAGAGAGAGAANTGVSSLLKQGPATPYSEEGLAAAQQRILAPIDEQGKQLMGRRQQVGNVQVQGETENLRSIMERQAAEGDVYKGRGERIAAREAALGKQGEENKGLAFLNAGLAIMSSRGPLGEAIGKGARVGTEQYAAGIEKIRAAQERLELAKDTLDDLRLHRSDMNRKEVKDAEASLRKARVDAEKYGLEGAEMLFGVKAKNAQDLYNKVADIPKTMFENQQANARTAISANSQINMIRQLAADPKLMAMYQSIHGKKSNIMDDYNDFVKANPQYLANPEKGLNAFLATQQLLGVGGAGGGAGAAGNDLKIVNVRPSP